MNNCPYCDSSLINVEQRIIHNRIHHYAKCPVCLMQGPIAEKKDVAIRAWNTLNPRD